jgi:lysozyme
MRMNRLADVHRVRTHLNRQGNFANHVTRVTHPPITETEAQVYLARDLQTALAATLRYCPVLAAEPEGRISAIVDFTFNLGAGRLQTSTLRRRINQRDWAAASQELRRWVYGGGKMLPGLVTRREAEAEFLHSSGPIS